MKATKDKFTDFPLLRLFKSVEETGVSVEREAQRFTMYNVDMSFPFVILTLCLRGSARATYDMREMTQQKNDLGLILPGHIMRPISCSEDYAYARLAISQKMFGELRSQLFSHDYYKFNYSPVCSLTDIQAQRLLSILENIALIASHSEVELQHRNHILMAQMAVGYEFVNYYRKQQDSLFKNDRKHIMFSRFCELVASHYIENKDTLFYAEQLDTHPKYMSRVIREVTNGVTPKEWIERYVLAQAKRQISIHPDKSLKDIAFNLGFKEFTSFYRYFKRVSGITPRDYRNTI